MKLLKWWNFQFSSVKHIQSLFNCSEFWHFKVIVTFSYITSKLMHITSTLSYITLEVELFYFSKRNVSGVPVHKSLCLSVCLFFSFFHYFEWVFYQEWPSISLYLLKKIFKLSYFVFVLYRFLNWFIYFIFYLWFVSVLFFLSVHISIYLCFYLFHSLKRTKVFTNTYVYCVCTFTFSQLSLSKKCRTPPLESGTTKLTLSHVTECTNIYYWEENILMRPLTLFRDNSL
jgi:hypothetical protein